MSQKEEPAKVIPKEITQLLERRATLAGWLGKLDELQETVRAQVHERVRADYEERLRQKESELAAHRSEMETALHEHRTRVTALEADRDEQAGELEEAELRFAVGEFKEGEFQKQKAKHDQALTDLDTELEADRGALEELQEVVGVLASLGKGGTPRPVGEVWTSAPDAEEIPPAEEAEAAEDTADAADGAADEDSIQDDTGREEAEAEAEAAPDAETTQSAGETATPAATEDYLDDLEFLESLSMEDIDRLDSVSAILAEETEEGAEEGPGRRT